MSDSKIRIGVLTVEVVERAAAGESVDWKSYAESRLTRLRLLAQGTGVRLQACRNVNSHGAGRCILGRPAHSLERREGLSPSAAEALAKHKGDLFLDGLTTFRCRWQRLWRDIRERSTSAVSPKFRMLSQRRWLNTGPGSALTA
jgi:hypothetical protein